MMAIVILVNFESQQYWKHLMKEVRTTKNRSKTPLHLFQEGGEWRILTSLEVSKIVENAAKYLSNEFCLVLNLSDPEIRSDAVTIFKSWPRRVEFYHHQRDERLPDDEIEDHHRIAFDTVMDCLDANDSMDFTHEEENQRWVKLRTSLGLPKASRQKAAHDLLHEISACQLYLLNTTNGSQQVYAESAISERFITIENRVNENVESILDFCDRVADGRKELRDTILEFRAWFFDEFLPSLRPLVGQDTESVDAESLLKEFDYWYKRLCGVLQ